MIPESRIDESISRIFLLKEKFTEHYHLYFREDIDEVVEEHFNLSQEIITGSVIVHDERGTIPLRLEQGAVLSAVIPNLREITQVEELRASMKESENAIVTGIKKRYGSALIDRYSLPPDDNEIQIAVEHAGHADCTVLFSYNAHLDHRQTEFILNGIEQFEALYPGHAQEPVRRVYCPRPDFDRRSRPDGSGYYRSGQKTVRRRLKLY